MRQGAVFASHAEQTRRVARMNRRLRDQFGRKVVIEISDKHDLGGSGRKLEAVGAQDIQTTSFQLRVLELPTVFCRCFLIFAN